MGVTVTAGGRAYFDVTASGKGVTYQWQYYTGSSWTNLTGSAYTGVTDPTLIVAASSGQDGLQLRCKVKNSAGTVYTKTATLHVQN